MMRKNIQEALKKHEWLRSTSDEKLKKRKENEKERSMNLEERKKSQTQAANLRIKR